MHVCVYIYIYIHILYVFIREVGHEDALLAVAAARWRVEELHRGVV